jgi:hypothetical protein
VPVWPGVDKCWIVVQRRSWSIAARRLELGACQQKWIAGAAAGTRSRLNTSGRALGGISATARTSNGPQPTPVDEEAIFLPPAQGF